MWRRTAVRAYATITTQTGACCRAGRLRGDAWVFVGSKCFAAGVALAMALAIGGCSNPNFDTSGTWFAKPLDLFGTRGGYTYSNLNDSGSKDRPITANDLVDANGGCPAPHAPPATQQGAVANADAGALPSGDLASMLGGNVAIGMSECDVVARLGQPSAVNLGKYSNGYRSAILTFNGGPRPGIYRFEAGRLTEMDRVEVPPPPPEPAKKKVAKKKPAKPATSATPSSTGDKS